MLGQKKGVFIAIARIQRPIKFLSGYERSKSVGIFTFFRIKVGIRKKRVTQMPKTLCPLLTLKGAQTMNKWTAISRPIPQMSRWSIVNIHTFSPGMQTWILGQDGSLARYRDLTDIYNTCSFA